MRKRAPLRPVLRDDAAVVRDDHFLDDRQAEAGAVSLGRDERLEDVCERVLRNARSVVLDGNANRRSFGQPFDTNRGNDGRSGAGLGAIADQVADRLPQQNLIPQHTAELPRDDDAARLERLVGDRALDDGPQIESGRA